MLGSTGRQASEQPCYLEVKKKKRKKKKENPDDFCFRTRKQTGELRRVVLLLSLMFSRLHYMIVLLEMGQLQSIK